jgi:hypothetical protein
MIVLNLSCQNGHTFEGWFASREAFDGQRQRGLVQCAHCSSDHVDALPSGPRVLRHAESTSRALTSGTTATPMAAGDGQAVMQMPAPEYAQKLFQALATMARQAENVGERFPEEARRIHYEEAPARSIRGIASADETQELLEEGILVLPAPVPSEGELH